jgi:hypothetical protein
MAARAANAAATSPKTMRTFPIATQSREKARVSAIALRCCGGLSFAAPPAAGISSIWSGADQLHDPAIGKLEGLAVKHGGDGCAFGG